MPDITMCSNDKCLKNKICYRYVAKPDNHWQGYADFSQKPEEIGCKYFYPICSNSNTKKKSPIKIGTLLSDIIFRSNTR